MTDTKSAIYDALSNVLDPCSASTDRPVDIVTMGLVEDVTVEDGTAQIELLLTSQECTFFLHMCGEIEERLTDIDGISNVTVTQEREKLWTPDRMADEEREARRERFRAELAANDIEPYYQDDASPSHADD